MPKPLLGTAPGHLYAVVSETFGRLAQLARASPLQGEGRGFESLNAHYFFTSCDVAQPE